MAHAHTARKAWADKSRAHDGQKLQRDERYACRNRAFRQLR